MAVWRDPISDPPPETFEVIICTETGRVTASRYFKGKFNTYVPVVGWMEMPPPMELPSEEPKPKAKTKKKAVKKP